MNDAEEKVILVDSEGKATGEMPKLEAHRKGVLHRAFSVFLFDDRGRLLLQKRASGKYHSGGLWTNTVCSHPRPGEDTASAARRRLREEMGMEADLKEIFSFVYRAELDGGLTEHEFDHVFIGRAESVPRPDPSEAEDFAYMHLHDIREDIRRRPEKYTAWFKIIFEKSFDTLLREAGRLFADRPLVFLPHFEEKIWGGTRLRELFGKPVPSDRTGESWEVSAVPHKESRVKDGFFKGFTLGELWHILGDSYFGTDTSRPFPLLVKYIDAREDLSVQVHPDDELARARHGGYGKNETWYIVDALPDSRLYIGFKPGVTREDYLRALREGKVEDLLREIPVRPGDWYFIPAGTVHAIGQGILLAEVQQSSDITYRIYDYNRIGPDGKPRPLHVDEALDAIRFEAEPFQVESHKLETPYFTMEKIHCHAAPCRDRAPVFTVWMNPSGEAELNGTPLAKGETALLFAGQPAVYLQKTPGPAFRIRP
ncbi:MAG: isopentenyl-diphosphate Delta-isomerase [Chlorobi bacterium]|nr:isopentenyl-diphosphate Delta-isomerase [Chlorobiota bacterium]